MQEIAENTRIRLHRFLPASRSNGPGLRSVVWMQGCTLGCPDCYNAATHSEKGGSLIGIDELLKLVQTAPGTVGITVTGGEPFQQAGVLLSFLHSVRRSTDLSIVLFTGYTMDELIDYQDRKACLPLIDVLIAGRYDASQHLARGLKGSSNQVIYLLSGRYSIEDLQKIPSSEVILSKEGEIIVTGIRKLAGIIQEKNSGD